MNDGRRALEQRFPGRRISIEGEGQFSVAYRVDDELIVRMPRHPHGVAQLRFEVAVLHSVRTQLSVSVPDIVDVELDLPLGHAYVAHRRIGGRVLRRDDVASMTHRQLDAIGSQIGRFLRELHAISPAAVPMVPVRTAAQFAADLINDIDTLLRPRIADEQQIALALESVRPLMSLPAEPLVLAHTDVGGNVVVDDQGHVGIIDFASCLVTHPAFDVASLSVLGDDIVRSAAAEYELLGSLGHESDTVAGTFLLQDALNGARQDDWDYVRNVLAAAT